MNWGWGRCRRWGLLLKRPPRLELGDGVVDSGRRAAFQAATDMCFASGKGFFDVFEGNDPSRPFPSHDLPEVIDRRLRSQLAEGRSQRAGNLFVTFGESMAEVTVAGAPEAWSVR